MVWKRKVSASYTVELALLMPLILFVLVVPVYLGLDLYQELNQESVSEWKEEIDAVTYMRKEYHSE